MSAPMLTLVDVPLLVDGEIDQAWTWQSEEPGCPHLGPNHQPPAGNPPVHERKADAQ